jgi:hypothetical protein
MKHLGREAAMFLILAAMVLGPAVVAQQPAAGQPPAGGGLSDLVSALKATPGCVGVETARTSSGKQVIFAWFENKKAALTWYYSETHRNAVRMLAPDAPARTPMADVPDDDNPVLAIASLTPADGARGAQPPAAGRMPFAVSQIAIELYRPLPGGIAAGGRFAPAALKVPGLIDIPMPVATSKQH